MNTNNAVSRRTPRRLASGLLLLLIVMLGVNLRPILTAVGPLLTEIRASTGLGFQGAALMTTLPVLCMGLFALLLPWCNRWLSMHAWIVTGIATIAAACLWRFFLDGSAALIASALLAGIGVALVQTFAPGLIKQWFPGKMPSVMGLYSASLMAGGGTAAMLSPLVVGRFGDWHMGLGVWALPAVTALALWLAFRPLSGEGRTIQARGPNFMANPRAWLLAVYLGVINGGYTSMVAWLPVFYRQLGWTAADSGAIVGWMTLLQVLGALAIPVFTRQRPDRRPALATVLTLQIVGLAGLIMTPLAQPWLWVGLIGCGLGASFVLCLTLTLEHLHEARAAGSLAAFVQGVGFIITGLYPSLTGWLRDITGSFLSSWILLMITIAMMLIVTARFSPSSYASAMNMPRP